MVIVVLLTVLAIASSMGLIEWARRISMLYACPRWARHLPWYVLASYVLGIGNGCLPIGSAWFDRATGAARARVLAAGIAEGMNSAAFVFVVLVAGWALTLFVFSRRWSRRPPDVPNKPPYR
jgi:hypothetical protein